MRLAILGATGHVGRNIAERWSAIPDCNLYLFSRKPAASLRLVAAGIGRDVPMFPYESFESNDYDAIVNCIGIADPNLVRDAGLQLFRVTEEYDNRILRYLERRQQCRYVNFSSGAVYGTEFELPASDSRPACYTTNPISPDSYYGLVKLYSEAKHRAANTFSIVDLRLFGFFSKHVDLTSGFLLSEAARCILQSIPLQTSTADIVRDYVHPDDLFHLVRVCVESAPFNGALDVYSLQPVTKFDLLEMLQTEFNLTHQIHDDIHRDATGLKMNYFSQSRNAKMLGYDPKYTAIEAVQHEMRKLLAENK